MISVTLIELDGRAQSSLPREVDTTKMWNLRSLDPTDLATDAIFEYEVGPSQFQTWKVSENCDAVAALVTTDQAESGAEVITNKVTSVSGSSTDTEYPSAKLLYDQLALKAPLASPALTGTPTAPSAPTTTTTTQLATTEFVQKKITPYGSATGTDTYAVTLTPSFSVAVGHVIAVRFTNANTGPATLAANGGSALAITRKDGSTALSSGDIGANTWHLLFLQSIVTGWVLLDV